MSWKLLALYRPGRPSPQYDKAVTTLFQEIVKARGFNEAVEIFESVVREAKRKSPRKPGRRADSWKVISEYMMILGCAEQERAKRRRTPISDRQIAIRFLDQRHKNNEPTEMQINKTLKTLQRAKRWQQRLPLQEGESLAEEWDVN